LILKVYNFNSTASTIGGSWGLMIVFFFLGTFGIPWFSGRVKWREGNGYQSIALLEIKLVRLVVKGKVVTAGVMGRRTWVPSVELFGFRREILASMVRLVHRQVQKIVGFPGNTRLGDA
jgi:hypothetical protein